MKAYIVQPYYSLDGDKDIDKCYNGMLALMDSIPVGADIEYADDVTLMRALAGRSEL